MKKHLFTALTTLAAFYSVSSNATNALAGIGAQTTLGGASSEHSVSTGQSNPAVGMLMIGEGESWRINYFPAVGAEVELGSVDGFEDELDDLIDFIDDPSNFDGDLEDTRERFNNVLGDLGENGYVRGVVGIELPLFPFYVKALGGTLSFDARLDANVSLQVLDDEITINEQRLLSTSTSLYVKAGESQTFSAGYSRNLHFLGYRLPKHTQLYGGINFSLTRLALSKQVAWIEDLGDSDAADFVEDQYDNNQNTTTNFDIDLGLVLDSKYYRVGFTVANLLSPEFDFGDIGISCEDLLADSDVSNAEINSCFVARQFGEEGRIDLTETHVRNTLPTLDGLLKLGNRWDISAAIDLASFNDISGFEYQLLNVATSIRTRTKWLPDMRLGYRKNLFGFETSSVAVGFTFFKSIEFDLRYGLETTTADDTTVPRTLGFSLAISESF